MEAECGAGASKPSTKTGTEQAASVRAVPGLDHCTAKTCARCASKSKGCACGRRGTGITPDANFLRMGLSQKNSWPPLGINRAYPPQASFPNVRETGYRSETVSPSLRNYLPDCCVSPHLPQKLALGTRKGVGNGRKNSESQGFPATTIKNYL